MPTLMYDVAFWRNDTKRNLHIFSRARQIAVVYGVQDSTTFRAYHLHDGFHWTPDCAAIRAALPYYHRKAFDRAGTWFFPLTLRRALDHRIYRDNAASLTLTDTRGRLLGTIYATPYLL